MVLQVKNVLPTTVHFLDLSPLHLTPLPAHLPAYVEKPPRQLCWIPLIKKARGYRHPHHLLPGYVVVLLRML